MQLPFSPEEFFNVFKQYNERIFPLQIVFYLIAFLAIYLIFRPRKNSGRVIYLILSFFWLWIGVVYHILHFSSINKAAMVFGGLYIIQAVIFILPAIKSKQQEFIYSGNYNNYAGILFLFYSLIIYPLLGYMSGHRYPYSPTFGLPCPTTIFTFGVLLFSTRRTAFWMPLIPLLWALIGFTAALKLSVYEDAGLLIAGVAGYTMLLTAKRGAAELRV